MKLRLLLNTAGIALVCACDAKRGATPEDAPLARDSAGVEIVTNTAPDTLLALRLALKFGVVEGDPDLQFSGIRALALDSAGGIWVVDRHQSVRHYDSTGVYLGSVGSAGRGPGEAQGYGHVWLGSDELIAWGYPGSLQRFTLAGKFLGSRTAMGDDGSLLRPIGFGAGRWYFSAQKFRPGGAAVFRSSVSIVASRGLTGEPDSIGVFAGDLYRNAPGGEYGQGSFFFGNSDFAVDRAGRLFVSDTMNYQVALFGPAGRVIRLLRRSSPGRAFDPAWRSDIVQGAAMALPGYQNRPVDPALRDRVVDGILSPDPPPQLPFIGSFLVAPGGELWIERADRHPRPGMRAVAHAYGYVRHAWRTEWKAPQVYDLFGATGAYRGTVQFPSDFEPMAATADRVYGVLYDELGVEYIAVFHLTTVH